MKVPVKSLLLTIVVLACLYGHVNCVHTRVAGRSFPLKNVWKATSEFFRKTANRVRLFFAKMETTDFAKQCLKEHNHVRAIHNAPPLVLSRKLSALAQERAIAMSKNSSAFYSANKHGYGENWAIFTDTHPEIQMTPREVVIRWYNEIPQNKKQWSSIAHQKFRHFSQVVWVGSKYLGVGTTISESGKIFIVCLYDPPGNIRNKFGENVFPTTDPEDY